MKKDKPLVSVIIPCFNHGIYLEECIKSVKDQTYQNIEIIIVNDGSTDNKTISVINNFNEGQIKIINKENGGLSSARNAGIIAAEGEYILPLDADDKIGETYVEKAVNIFCEKPEIQLVYCRGKYFGDRTDNMCNTFISYKSMLLYNTIFASCLYKKKDALEVGLYNETMLKGFEDWDFLIRLLAGNKKSIQICDILFYYRITEGSMFDTIKKSKSSLQETENIVFKNNFEKYFENWGSIIEVLRNYEILKNKEIIERKAVSAVYGTASYKLGHFLLSPLKFLNKIRQRKH